METKTDFEINSLKEAASAEIRHLWDRIAKLEAELESVKTENWGLSAELKREGLRRQRTLDALALESKREGGVST